MMKLLSPLNETCNVKELSRYADEYYLGVCDEEWQKYQSKEFNARGFSQRSNFSGWEALSAAVSQARDSGIPCYLTVNTHNIGRDGMEIVHHIIDRFQQIGGEGIISSNLDAMLYARGKHMKVMVSTIVGIYNEDAIRMICELVHPDRIVLNRDMRYDSVLRLRQLFPDIELEVFGAFFGCKYSNAFCYCSHQRDTGGMCRMMALSEWSFKNKYELPDSRDLFETEKNHWLYANYLFDGACSVCALYRLSHIGIDSLKIVGREMTGEKLLCAVQQMSYYLNLAREAESEKEYFSALTENPVGTSHLGCFGGYQCYYPEISHRGFW